MIKENIWIKQIVSILTLIMLTLTIGQSVIAMICVQFDVFTEEKYTNTTNSFLLRENELWNATRPLVTNNSYTNTYITDTEDGKIVAYDIFDKVSNEWLFLSEDELFEVEISNKNYQIDYIKNVYSADVSNFQLKITEKADGKVILNTFGNGDYASSSTYNGQEYLIEYALQDPLTVDDIFKNAENNFFALKKYSLNIINSIFVYGILTIVGFLILNKLIKPKDREDFSFFEKMPTDFTFWALVIAGFATLCVFFEALNSNSLSYIYQTQLDTQIIEYLNYLRLFSVVPALLLLKFTEKCILHIKSKTLFKSTFIYLTYSLIKKMIVKLPIIWRTVILGLVICFINGILGMLSMTSAFMWFVFASYNVFMIVLLCSLAYQMKLLQNGAENLVKGKFQEEINTDKMYFDCKKYGQTLNEVRMGISLAVDEKLRSQRLKTELITNVSHDIKTPLTSIVTCVELLQKEHTEAEHKELLELLSRQSMRMKKLVEDLVEASNASTGNLNINLIETDLIEATQQALAEYEARFSTKNLEIITKYVDECCVLADGKYLWRVLDNLFSNIYKYAQIGTRVYISVEKNEENTEISIKNISEQALNLTSDELLERFIRGDASRTTEGSGLGLNIAQSLMQAQNGELKLTIDGDLVKVQLFYY